MHCTPLLSMLFTNFLPTCFGRYYGHLQGNIIITKIQGTNVVSCVDVTPFIHSVVCLTTGLKPLSKWALHIVRSRASSFKWEYPLLSLRSSNIFLRLLPCLPVTSIPPCIFPSVTRCRRQFRRKMWPQSYRGKKKLSINNTTTVRNTTGNKYCLWEAILNIVFERAASNSKE